MERKWIFLILLCILQQSSQSTPQSTSSGGRKFIKISEISSFLTSPVIKIKSSCISFEIFLAHDEKYQSSVVVNSIGKQFHNWIKQHRQLTHRSTKTENTQNGSVLSMFRRRKRNMGRNWPSLIRKRFERREEWGDFCSSN